MASDKKSKLLGTVQKFLSKGQHQKALEGYLKILKHRPYDTAIRLKTAELYERVGQNKEAIKEYHRVANSFAAQGFYPRAVAVLSRILNLDPKLQEIHLELAELNQKLGRIAESVRHFQSAASLESRTGHKRQSIDILKKIADLEPANIERRLEVAVLYYREGLADPGYEQYCDSVNDLDPASQELLELTQRMHKIAPQDYRLRLKLAEIHLARREPKIAVEVLEPAFQEFRTARLVELLAEAKAQSEEVAEAKELLEEAIELYKSDWDPQKRRELAARLVELSAAVPGAGGEQSLTIPPAEGSAEPEQGPSREGEEETTGPAQGASREGPEEAAESAQTDPPEEVPLEEDTSGPPPIDSGPEEEPGQKAVIEIREPEAPPHTAGTEEASEGADRKPTGDLEDPGDERKLDAKLAEADATFRRGNRAAAISSLEEVSRLYPHRSDPLFRLLWIHDYSANWVGVADLSRRIADLMEERGDSARAARYYAEAAAAEARLREVEGMAPEESAEDGAAGPGARGEGDAGRTRRGGGAEVDILIDNTGLGNSGASVGGGAACPPDEEMLRRATSSISARIGASSELRQLIEADPNARNRYVMEKTVLSTAFRHALTGLPIRALFMDRLQQALTRARRESNYTFAVLVLDLDRFKLVNDSLGHAVGDELLVAIARRLEETLREGNTAAYLGGDEFVILLEEVRDASDAVRVAEQLRKRIAMPFKLQGHEVFTSASIGIALNSRHYERAEELLRDADTAMYRAKAQGKSRYEVFDEAMHARAITLLELETDLRRAVERGDFHVQYQPIISLTAGKIIGFEALARWQHPSGTLIPPDDFIPMAEEIALVIPIDRWVLSEACTQLKKWQSGFPHDPELTMNVNLSGKHFAESDMIEHIKGVVDKTGIDPVTLKLEITESVVMENVEEAHSVLTRMKKLKVKLNMDDFGTGHSSLAALHRFPFDALKIDRAFVHGIGEAAENEEIVRTIISLGKSLGMSVVAEGIETEEQFATLRRLGCDHAQGFLFSPAINAEDMDKLLKKDPIW